MQTALLTLLATASAVLHLRAEYIGPDWQVYTFKPLTMIFILLLVLRVVNPVSVRYKRIIAAGLGASLVGDVLLMLPLDLFLPGLIVFLLAHVVYIAALWLASPRERAPWWTPLPFMLYGVFVYSMLLPGLEDMTIPVLVYVVVISVMGWFALRRWWMVRNAPALLAVLGAVFFILSDSVLAANRFLRSFDASTAVVLVTYYVAQWLLARSVEASPAS